MGSVVIGAGPAEARPQPGLTISVDRAARRAYRGPSGSDAAIRAPGDFAYTSAPADCAGGSRAVCDVAPLHLAMPTLRPGDDLVLTVTVTWDPGPAMSKNVLLTGLWDRRHEHGSFVDETDGVADTPVRTGGSERDGTAVINYVDPPTADYDLVVDDLNGSNVDYAVSASMRVVHDAAVVATGRPVPAPSPPARRGGPALPSARTTAAAPAGDAPLSLDPRLAVVTADQTHPGRHGGPRGVSPWIVLVAAAAMAGAAGLWLAMARRRGAGETRSMRARVGRRVRDVGLFWKLLAPFVAILLVIGVVGVFVTVRYLQTRAQTALDQSLLQRSAGADAYLRDQELGLLESVRLAANLEGLPEAVAARNQAAVAGALASAAAVHPELDVLAATDRDGTGLVDYTATNGRFSPHASAAWAAVPSVAQVLAGVVDAAGDKRDALIRLADGSRLLIVVGPVRTDRTVGAVVAGISLDKLVRGASGRAGGDVAVYDSGGSRMASSGRPLTPAGLPAAAQGGDVRDRYRAAGRQVATSYRPWVVRGKQVGTLAVTSPLGSAFDSVRGAGYRLAFVVGLAMVAIAALGVLLSRYILRALNPLVATNRALAAGDLSARTPVFGHDELGEVAEGVNHMASALQESYETLEAKVDERTAEVRRLLQERTDFFTAVSHEFRTPLAVILSRAKMLEDKAAAADFTAAGGQLLGFINDILEIARADAGSIDLDVAPVDLAETVEGLRPQLETLAVGSGLRLTIQSPSYRRAVLADPARVRQILLNLVDNAVKYTPRGGVVDIAVTGADGGGAITVVDTGVGIPPEAARRLFEPFYRVSGIKAQNGQQSSGLGLALVKRLVEAQGGAVSFRSEPGQGSSFTVTFPEVEPADLAAGRAGHQPSGPAD